MRFASSDIISFHNNACPEGGHRRTVTNQKDINKGKPPEYAEDRLIIECLACEPLLVGVDSWSNDPDNIPLTHKEVMIAQKNERELAKSAAEGQILISELARELLAAKAGK